MNSWYAALCQLHLEIPRIMWNSSSLKDFAFYIGKQFVRAKQIIISEIINLSDTIRFKREKLKLWQRR